MRKKNKNIGFTVPPRRYIVKKKKNSKKNKLLTELI